MEKMAKHSNWLKPILPKYIPTSFSRLGPAKGAKSSVMGDSRRLAPKQSLSEVENKIEVY